MENKKSPLLVYREKMAEVHTPKEIKVAFDDSFYAAITKISIFILMTLILAS